MIITGSLGGRIHEIHHEITTVPARALCDPPSRPVVWYPGATPEQIENTVVKALCYEYKPHESYDFFSKKSKSWLD